MTISIDKTPEGAVVIDYADLLNETSNLDGALEEAFSNKLTSLGLIVVKNVPTFVEKRKELLHIASEYANLPDEIKKKCEHEESRYSFGWSHGKEFMNGKPDLAKGSFYANPTCEVPTLDKNLIEQFPEYCHQNIWPSDCPQLRPAFISLGSLMVDVGFKLAKKLDSYVEKHIAEYPKGYLQSLIFNSSTHKGRLLHYFPLEENTSQGDDIDNMDSWCGWHLDHGSLTGLTCAEYIDESISGEYKSVTPNDPKAGLYIKTRGNEVVKVNIPKDSIAFQMGEALQLVSRGKLQATPHCVRGCQTKEMGKVARNTFAVFMQPNIFDEMEPGMTFADFTKTVLNEHY